MVGVVASGLGRGHDSHSAALPRAGTQPRAAGAKPQSEPPAESCRAGPHAGTESQTDAGLITDPCSPTRG